MKSLFSDEVSGQVGPPEQPMAPVILNHETVGNKTTLMVRLPAASADGQPLLEGAFTVLHAFADTRSFLGRLEELLGMEPQAKLAVTVAQGLSGQPIAVEIPGLAFNTKYYYKVCVE